MFGVEQAYGRIDGLIRTAEDRVAKHSEFVTEDDIKALHQAKAHL
jgi:hypothetical protein